MLPAYPVSHNPSLSQLTEGLTPVHHGPRSAALQESTSVPAPLLSHCELTYE